MDSELAFRYGYRREAQLAAASTPVGKARNAFFELHQTTSTGAFD